MSSSFNFMLVLIVKDIFLVSPGPSQICNGKCILLSVLRHPAVGPREPYGGRALCLPPPQLARCQDLMNFLCKLNRLLESHLCRGLCGAGKESQLFPTVSVAMTGILIFCHQSKGGTYLKGQSRGSSPWTEREVSTPFLAGGSCR